MVGKPASAGLHMTATTGASIRSRAFLRTALRPWAKVLIALMNELRLVEEKHIEETQVPSKAQRKITTNNMLKIAVALREPQMASAVLTRSLL